jgi:uncharacterized membrane protein (UPF0127 family)
MRFHGMVLNELNSETALLLLLTQKRSIAFLHENTAIMSFSELQIHRTYYLTTS